MKTTKFLAATIVVAGLAAGTVPGRGQTAAYTPGPHNIVLPADWQASFVRYATVDKADRKIIRFLYVNPQAFAATRPDQPLPDGTMIVMQDWRARLDAAGNPLQDQQGRFIPESAPIQLAVQQKKHGWGAAYGPEKRNGEWEYAVFAPDGSRREVNLNGCFACHLPRAAQDYVFNYWDYSQGRR